MLRSLCFCFAVATIRASNLNIALHAQAAPSRTLIVGSVMTTSGLRKAFLRRGHSVDIFYPFHYDGLFSKVWNVFIIEGWFTMIASTIHEVRRTSPGVIVLYWCLDPDFPALFNIISLDVDGFLTNSKSIATVLIRAAPTQVVYLASDFDDMALTPLNQTKNTLVYVGSALGISTKRNLVTMLREAALSLYGLELWGTGWDTVGPSDLRPYWRGVLPFGKLAQIYSQAKAVLGATMDGQRNAAMINNRVFEVLAVGTPLIQESVPDIENMLQIDPRQCFNLLLWKAPGDVLNHSRALQHRDSFTDYACRIQSHRHIRLHHTYDKRALQVLDFIRGILNQKSTDRPHRHNAMRLALLSQQPCPASRPVLDASFLQYQIHLFCSPNQMDSSLLLDFDLIISIGDAHEHLLRQLPETYMTAKGIHQRRILLQDQPRAQTRHQVIYDVVEDHSSIDEASCDLNTCDHSLEAGLDTSFWRQYFATISANPLLPKKPSNPHRSAYSKIWPERRQYLREKACSSDTSRSQPFRSIPHQLEAFDLSLTVTRALCLGRGVSDIQIVWPPNQHIVFLQREVVLVPFTVDIHGFDVGRDGSWCLVATPGGIITCILQNKFQLALEVRPPDGSQCSATVQFHLELKSNVYSDVLRASDPVQVIFVGSSKASMQEQSENLNAFDSTTWDYIPPYICDDTPS